MSTDLPNSFRYHAGIRGIFRQHVFFTMLPELTDEFSEWMEKYFGPYQRFRESGSYWSERWYMDIEYQRVRSNRGAGNRGGWEPKPKYVSFVFASDADAILFKMQWGDIALPC